jgi:agmatinase
MTTCVVVESLRLAYSSPIRRASEMAHIDEIFQIGIRGQGSARIEEVEAARAYGANIITAAELEDEGTAAILNRISDGGRYYLTIDADGLDPVVMPAVAGPQPGGVTYRQTIDIIKGPGQEGSIGRHGYRRDHAGTRHQRDHLDHRWPYYP